MSAGWNPTTLRELSVLQTYLPCLSHSISQNPGNITSLTFNMFHLGLPISDMVSIINLTADTLQHLMLQIAAPSNFGIFDASTKPLNALIKLEIGVDEDDLLIYPRLSGSLSAPNLQNFILQFHNLPDHFREIFVKFDWDRFITTILRPSSSLDFAFGFAEDQEPEIEGQLREVIPQLGSRLRVLSRSPK